MRRRARDTPVAEAADNVEQSFQGEALSPVPRCRGRGNSGRGVVSGCICLDVIYWLDFMLL